MVQRLGIFIHGLGRRVVPAFSGKFCIQAVRGFFHSWIFMPQFLRTTDDTPTFVPLFIPFFSGSLTSAWVLCLVKWNGAEKGVLSMALQLGVFWFTVVPLNAD